MPILTADELSGRFVRAGHRSHSLIVGDEMRKIGTVIIAVVLTAFAALILINGRMDPLTANALAQSAKVNYSPIPGGDYQIDPAHSLIGFSIRHFEINLIHGRFKDFTGVIRYDESDVTK